MSDFLHLPNNAAIPLGQIPVLQLEKFRERILDGVRQDDHLAALFAAPADAGRRLFAILACPERARLSVFCAPVEMSYPALTPACAQAHLFEREIAEQTGIHPAGHPWLKPVRFPERAPADASRRGAATGQMRHTATPLPGARAQTPPRQCGVMDFFQITGEEIHEVAVGPVHAGIIEPGHFRFQCHGETVRHLEISLGYQHRGIEPALTGGPDRRTLHYMETLAGDTTIGHAMAYCQVQEALTQCRVPARAQAIRGIALELERIANHIGDLGALAGDIGFLPTMSYCGRIRGDILNLTALLCGNRFGRRLVMPGGTAYDLDGQQAALLHDRLKAAMTDAASAVGLLWETPSVLARFENTGAVPRELAVEIGLVGVAARACGLDRDVRRDFPDGIFQMAQIPVATWHTGDVFARAFVRWLETQRSAAFIRDLLSTLPEESVRVPCAAELPAAHLAVALTEGWRGEICHAAITGPGGRFASYKIVDPSFHNWLGLAQAMRGQQISDFPLCNKSFNLSYCGQDL